MKIQLKYVNVIFLLGLMPVSLFSSLKAANNTPRFSEQLRQGFDEMQSVFKLNVLDTLDKAIPQELCRLKSMAQSINHDSESLQYGLTAATVQWMLYKSLKKLPRFYGAVNFMVPLIFVSSCIASKNSIIAAFAVSQVRLTENVQGLQNIQNRLSEEKELLKQGLSEKNEEIKRLKDQNQKLDELVHLVSKTSALSKEA